ncbi:MAG: 16S rRNA (cytidine(1402)-2'-O)-methyltransferase, partial [Bryobacteraceae bacterium]
MSGKLYIVATPIGNMGDITYRAVRVLKEAAMVACEDTRHTRKLLTHYGIVTPLSSYHEHNEAARSGEYLELLRSGASIALVSDAGTPLISDPGYRLVSRAAAEGIAVIPIPGPSAVIAALSSSALPTDAFYFGGFLPAKQAQRRRLLEEVKTLDATLVFYEAPHRIVESLPDVEAILGARQMVIARELTKVHEEFLRGSVAEVVAKIRDRASIKGELTLMVGRPVA